METPPVVTEEMRVCFDSYFNKNDKDSLENVLLLLKDKGYSQMQSLFLLIEKLELSFMDANRTVMNSKAWNS